MPPIESELMLWAQRQISAFRAILEEALQALPSRFPFLAQGPVRVNTLEEQTQTLAVDSKHTTQRVQSLHDRMQDLEEAATLRNRESATRTEPLEEAIRDLARQLDHTVGAHEQFKRDARATAEAHELQIRELRTQIEVTIDTEKQRRARQWTLFILSRISNRRLFADTVTASKPLSEATTIDVSSNVEHRGPESPTTYQAQHSDWNIVQGRTSYKDYVASGEAFVQAALRQAEAQAVKALVSGMRQPFRRKPIEKILEEKGWTWAIARRELQKIVDEGAKRRANKRTIRLPTMKEMDTNS
ncbi:MAG: hypothetical protein LQ344_002566 [Seirophora lacunosa]|nr:MAG: hypothetical protein LQ344_002566 [Seirophora lacunosa]